MRRDLNTVRNKLRRGHGRVVLIAALAFCAAAWVSTASAQINPFRSYKGPSLSREDLQAGQAAAQKLLDNDPASVGQAESWTVPSSGDQGTLTIHRVFERSGMPCRALASEVLVRRSQTRRSYTLTVCRTADGAWKLAD